MDLLVRFRSRNSLATLQMMMANFAIIALASILHFRDQRNLTEATGANAAHNAEAAHGADACQGADAAKALTRRRR